MSHPRARAATALIVGLVAGLVAGFAGSPVSRAEEAATPWDGASAAVVAAEGDASRLAAARPLVEAAVRDHPDAAGPRMLAARLHLVEAKAAKSSPDVVAANRQALDDVTAAQNLEVRNPAPWKLRVDVLRRMSAPKEEVLEAFRSWAVRSYDDPIARELFEKWSGKKLAIAPGDPMPLLVWKDAAGKDVPVESLWGKRPVVVELFRTTVWCEYCRKRLYEFHDHSKDFEADDVAVVAVSPDGGEKIASIEKDGLKGRKPFRLRLLSDPLGEQAARLGLRNPDTVGPGVAADAYGLPYPTTLVIDDKGIVRFIESHEDFRNRTKFSEIMGAIKRIRAATPK